MRRIFVICTLLTIVGLLAISGRSKPDAGGAYQQQSPSDETPVAIDPATLTDVVAGTRLADSDQGASVQTITEVVSVKKKGIWIGPEELAALEMKGAAWEQLKSQAKQSAGRPDLSNNRQKNNVYVLAKALVYARCILESSHPQCSDMDLQTLHKEVVDQIMMIIGTEKGGSTLALGRELAAYVIAADLVTLPAKEGTIFKAWLRNVRNSRPDSNKKKTLISTHEERPNNWGTHAGASRIAIAAYLDDVADIRRSATVFKGWLGDRDAYSGFKYRYGFSWQCHADKPVGINPSGCTKNGHSIDGVLPDDQRRGGGFHWPPPKENYVYEALQGAIVQAVILHRLGYDAFNWEDQALLRAYRWLHDVANFPAAGDDTWQLPLVDCFYGTSYWKGTKTRFGKNMGWTGWTHSARNTITCIK